MSERLTVIELQTQNIMKAKSVHIKPDGAPIVVIGGNNGEGKTSLINSLVVGLCGKREWVSMPVSKGEQQGAVRIGLGKKGQPPLYVITQRINPDSLKIERTDGEPLGGSPRSVLDAKLGSLAFDPMALIRMDPARQADLVRKVYGIDLSAINAEYKIVYEDRRQANASLKAQQAVLDEYTLTDFSKLPDAKIDINDAMSELNKIKDDNANNQREYQQRKQDVLSAEKRVSEERRGLAEAENNIDDLKRSLGLAEQALDAKKSDVDSAEYVLKSAVEHNVEPELSATKDLEQKISTAGQINSLFAQKEKAGRQKETVGLIEKNVAGLNAKIEELKTEKTVALEDAKLPEGLSFAASGLELNGVPFEQASTTEQITVGFELSIKDDPEIGITCVRDASLLDKKHRAYIEDLAVEYGMQAWFEIVGDTEPNAFIIENGEVIREPEGVCDTQPEDGEVKSATDDCIGGQEKLF